MREARDAQSILALARKLLRESGQSNTAVEEPIEVRSPEGGLHSWFVPVSSGRLIAGFYEFLPDGTLKRFSTYRSDQALSDWLVPEKRVNCRPGETTGKPFLTYDRSPDRLVWAVPLVNERKESRLVFVAGETAYPPPDAVGQETG